jgi:hypothetical protein
MEAALTDDVVERFIRVVDGIIPARPRVRLPEAATSRPRNIEADTPLRLALGSRIYADAAPQEGMVKFKIGETDWTCATELVPAMRLLRQAHSTTLQEMMNVVDRDRGPELRAFVLGMAASGALWVEPTTADAVASSESR